jgi:hypothetical protein
MQDDQHTEEDTANKEMSQTNQNNDTLEKAGGGMGTLIDTVNDMFSK